MSIRRIQRCPGGPGHVHTVVPLFGERTRKSQLKRLKSMGMQVCVEPGKLAWQEAQRIWRELPADVRVDLPHWRVFAAVLGVFRSAATLKQKKMLVLELSGEEIAFLTGYKETQVQAALRWLRNGVIAYRGRVVAQGLGFLGRTVRKAKACVCGFTQGIFRTSLNLISEAGQILLGLASPSSEGEGDQQPRWLGRRREQYRRRSSWQVASQDEVPLFRNEVGLPSAGWPSTSFNLSSGEASDKTLAFFMGRATVVVAEGQGAF